MTPPLGPERLTELLHDAVRNVAGPADALDRIRRGVRRRRTAHRAGTTLLALAVLAGGGSAALAVTSGRAPSDFASSASASASVLPKDALGLDTATIVPVGNATTTSNFRLVVRLTQTGTQTVPFTATSATVMPPRGPVIVGAADAAHDGHTELFVLVDAGCCTEFWTVFRLVDDRVRQVTTAGQPVRLAVGGSTASNGGFSCAGPDLVTYAYQPGTTARTFLATRDTYRWVGATLVLAARQQTTIHGSSSDPRLAQYTGVACGSLPQYVSVG